MPIGGNIAGGGGGGAADPEWIEEVSADFTSLSTTAYSDDDTFSLGGVTWLVQEHDGAATQGEISAVSGSGLDFAPSGGASNIYTSINAPIVSCKIDDCMTGYSVDDLICVQFFLDEVDPIDANFDGYAGLIFEPAGAGSPQHPKDSTKWAVYDTYASTYSATGREYMIGFGHAGQVDKTQPKATKPTTIEMIYSPKTNQVSGAHSVAATLTPAPTTTNTVRGYCVTQTPDLVTSGESEFGISRSITIANGRLAFAAFKVVGSSGFHVHLKKIRVLRLKDPSVENGFSAQPVAWII